MKHWMKMEQQMKVVVDAAQACSSQLSTSKIQYSWRGRDVAKWSSGNAIIFVRKQRLQVHADRHWHIFQILLVNSCEKENRWRCNSTYEVCVAYKRSSAEESPYRQRKVILKQEFPNSHDKVQDKSLLDIQQSQSLDMRTLQSNIEKWDLEEIQSSWKLQVVGYLTWFPNSLQWEKT